MKTTIDFPDDLVLAAKQVALLRKTSLRNLVIRGLRRELQQNGPGTRHPVQRIVEVGKGDWAGVSADQHVETERHAWS